MSETEEALDRVLATAAEDEALARVLERAGASRHVDPELLDRYVARRLEEEEHKNVRRHLLFCDDCSAALLARTAAAEGASSAAPPPAPRPGIEASAGAPAPVAVRRVAPASAALILVAAGTVAVLVAIVRPGPDRNGPAPGALPPSWSELRIAGARERLASEVLRPGERLRFLCEPSWEGPVWVQILALTRAGGLVALGAPERRESAGAGSRGGALLPASRGTVGLGAVGLLEDGETLKILVATAPGLTPLFLADLRDREVLPELGAAAELGVASGSPDLAAERLAREIEERGLAARVQVFDLRIER